jgi:hypothetical protein
VIPLIVIVHHLHNHQFGHNTILVFLPSNPSLPFQIVLAIHCQSKPNNCKFAILSKARLYNNIQTTRFLAHKNINYQTLISATNYLNNHGPPHHPRTITPFLGNSAHHFHSMQTASHQSTSSNCFPRPKQIVWQYH